MDRRGLNAHDLYRLSGVSAPTTYRFLTGRHDEPKANTIRAWAHALGVTEGQLRGTEPIDGVNTPERARDLQDLLTPDEYSLVSNVKIMDKGSRDILCQLAERLVAEPQAAYGDSPGDRRKEEVYPNQQLRIGDNRHKTPPTKRRLKNHSNERDHFSGSKSSQIA